MNAPVAPNGPFGAEGTQAPLEWHKPVIVELEGEELEGILAFGTMAATEDGDGCRALLDVFVDARLAAVEAGDGCCVCVEHEAAAPELSDAWEPPPGPLPPPVEVRDPLPVAFTDYVTFPPEKMAGYANSLEIAALGGVSGWSAEEITAALRLWTANAGWKLHHLDVRGRCCGYHQAASLAHGRGYGAHQNSKRTARQKRQDAPI